MRYVILSAAAAVLAAGCSAPPKPARADESTRRPANDPAHIELLRAQAELQRARVELQMQTRGAAALRLAGEAAAERIPVVLQARREPLSVASGSGANTVYTVRFPAGGTKLALSPQAVDMLAGSARQSSLVVVRGRTDALRDNPTDLRIARQRAEAARTLLVARGVSASRIRVTWQGAGDTVADNATAEGRALNRRVEIEVYATEPTAAPPAVAQQPTVAAR